MTKLTTEQKMAISLKIEEKIKTLGTSNQVAIFCDVSESVISQMRAGTYITKKEEAWTKVGGKLGWKPEINTERQPWAIVETRDYRIIKKVVFDAKNESVFLAISEVAGSGKTAALQHITETNIGSSIFYIQCWDWGKREFLEALCQTLGIDIARGYRTPNKLLELVIEFFKRRSLSQPVLIVDEADKLKDAAKRIFITLENSCLNQLGVVIAGTEHLEEEIKRGIRYKKKGYNEIGSRFQRFARLIGPTIEDVRLICKANGVMDETRISKFFKECNPKHKLIEVKGQMIPATVIEDLRRLRRIIKREQLQAIESL